MKRQSRWAAVLLLIIGLAPLVLATTAAADDTDRGWGIVMSRDLGNSTLEIGNRVFRVTPQTVFKDKAGALVTFETLEIFDVHQDMFDMADATVVEYVSVATASGPELESVKVVSELPR